MSESVGAETIEIMDVPSQDQMSNLMSVQPSGYLRLAKIGLVLAGSCAIVFAFVTRGAVIAENSRDAIFVPLAVGAALIISGFSVGSRWQAPAFWFSVAMVGQTVSLQLINAGYQLRYQHYKPITELLLYPNSIYVGAVLFHLAVVSIGLRKHFPTLWRWARTHLRAWQVIILGICFFVPTTTLSVDVSRYVAELLVAGFVQLISAATFILFAMSIPRSAIKEVRTAADRFTATSHAGLRQFPFVFVIAVLVTVASATLNIFSYERHPHVPDEVAYLQQARFFAAGTITMPAPPVPEAFDVYLMKVDGDVWYPVTPPGWAMILALGTLVGAPFIVNPILAGLNVLLAYWLLSRLYTIPKARFAVVLLAASPWFVFLAMSFMTHMAALACLLLAAIGVVKAREAQKWNWGLLSGAAIGFVSLIRPLEAIAIAGLIGVWVLGLGGTRLRISAISAVAIGTLLVGGLGLAFNATLTGHPLRFPINVYTDEVFGVNSNAYGFGPDRGMGWELDPNPGHGPVDALINTNLNVSALNTELLGWSIGSFLMIGAFLCFAKLRRSDYLMFAVVAVIYLLHFFYYFSGGPDFGARYWFLMIVPLITLTARGIESLADKLDETADGAGTRLYAAVGALIILTICVFIPWRAVDKYHNFRGMMPDVRELSAQFGFGRSLVLIRGAKNPDYDSAFVYNSDDLDGDGPVYAWDRDAETRRKLLTVYSDRPVWIVDGPSVTDEGYKVAQGPLTPGSMTPQ
jgi:hypothetical protein